MQNGALQVVGAVHELEELHVIVAVHGVEGLHGEFHLRGISHLVAHRLHFTVNAKKRKLSDVWARTRENMFSELLTPVLPLDGTFDENFEDCERL